MARHHYVPQFLLREWATNGQIMTYRWLDAARKVIEGGASVVEACQVEDLNAFFGLPRGQREAPERDFWTPNVDTPAADAHRTILEKESARYRLVNVMLGRNSLWHLAFERRKRCGV
jgi:hypothetical protein